MVMTSRKRRSAPLAALAVALLALGCAQSSEPPAKTTVPPLEAVPSNDPAAPPSFRVDPFWPRELPNNWILGQVSGLSVDAEDYVWIVHRPGSLDSRQRGEEGLCCVPAPPVIEFSPDGTVLRAWGGPGDGFEWPQSEHGIHVDHQGHVWIGANGGNDAHVLKFTKEGEFLLQIGRAGQSGGSSDTHNLGRPAAVEVDPGADEVYIADGYGNRRIIVFDASTGAYKRHWGAYGDRPDDRELAAYDPEAEPIDQFRSPVHDVALSGDGLVYVADRTNNRLQVFQQDGTFVTESFIRTETLGSGAVSGIVLSPDPGQQWLFVPDGTNNVVWILDRSSLAVVSHFGRLGKYAGQFYRLHNLDVDSRGNLYSTEVGEGQRVQRFDRMSG